MKKDDKEKTEEIYVASMAAESVPKTVPKDDYSKEIRKKIDDINKRNKFRNESFGDKKTIKDSVSDNTLHLDSNAAKRKYGQKAYTKHIVHTDHDIPLEKVYQKTQNNPFLDYDDIKEIANISDNYTLTNGNYNMSKGSKSDIEMAMKSDDSIKNRTEMVKKHIKSDIAIEYNIGKKTIQKAHEIGIDGAKEGIKAGVPISAAHHLSNVVRGEEEFDEAILNMGLDTAKMGATSYGVSISKKMVEGIAETVAKNTANGVLKESLKKFVESSAPGKIAVMVIEVGDVVTAYLNGDIDADELIAGIAERGTAITVSAIGSEAGAAIGAIIGGAIGTIALPGGGTLAGEEIGKYIGAFVGYLVGSEIYCKLQSFLGGKSGYYKALEKEYKELEKKISEYRKQLEQYLVNIDIVERESIYAQFQIIHEGMINDDQNKITVGLNGVCREYGISVRFDSLDKFDSFMNDPNSKVILGK